MKYLTSKLLLIAFTLFVFACEAPKKAEKEAKAEMEAKKEAIKKEVKVPTTLFEKSVAFHGGLETWNSFGTLKFDRVSAQGTSTHTLDLKNRNELIKNPESTLTFTETGYWNNPDQVNEKGERQNPRFFRNLWFYFFGLPFVTADPGANQETMEDATLDGKTYNRVKITFGENVGDAPDDQYILWLDPTTKQLELINYSVTYGKGKEASEKYNVIVFNEWQTVNGLKVPKAFKGHAWEDNKIGDVRYEFEFSNVSFSTERPDPSFFSTPEGAYYEDYK